jgi:hypothetical protein
MQKYLDDLSLEASVVPEWKELLRDLNRLQQVRLRHRVCADWLGPRRRGAKRRVAPSRSHRAAAARPANCPAEDSTAHEANQMRQQVYFGSI